MTEQFEVDRTLGQARCPVLIVDGEKDGIWPPRGRIIEGEDHICTQVLKEWLLDEMTDWRSAWAQRIEGAGHRTSVTVPPMPTAAVQQGDTRNPTVVCLFVPNPNVQVEPHLGKQKKRLGSGATQKPRRLLCSEQGFAVPISLVWCHHH